MYIIQVNPLNAELNPIYHLLALLRGAHHIFHLGGLRVKHGQSGIGAGLFSSECPSLYVSLSFHQCSILVFTYVLLVPEGKTGESWEITKKQRCCENWGAFDRNFLAFWCFKRPGG